MLVKIVLHKQLIFWTSVSLRIATNSVFFLFLKLINNSSSLNKKNHDRDGVWISDLNWHRFLWFHFPVYSLVLVSIEKIYQTRETVFHRLSKHLEFRQKYSAARRIFNSLLGVWISRWNTVSRVWYITSNNIDYLSNRPQVSMVYRQINHAGCW